MTTESVKKNTTIISALKKQAIVLNKEMLQASNELVENSAKTAEKWQNLTEKVLGMGTKMLAKQQEVALTTIETAVGQFIATRSRFNKLVGTKPKKVKPSADETLEAIESDLTIDEVMNATIVEKPKKATVSKKKTATQAA
jgi:hypothetical protein